jgi:hypothetical protein
MGKRINEEIIELAKELYLTPDMNGNHKYSLRDIARECEQKVNRKLPHTTIMKWVRKYGWDKIWEEGIRYGITAVIAKQESNQTKEEQFKEAIAQITHERISMDMDLIRFSHEYIIKRGFSSVEEARRVYETASKDLQTIEYLKKIDEKEARNIYDDPIWDELEDNPEIRTIIIKTIKKYEK